MGGANKPHEGCEVNRVGDRSEGPADGGGVFRRRIEDASRDSGSLVWKQIVRDADLDVVGFAGKDEERFVLSLPVKARDRTIAAGRVQSSTDVNCGPRDLA